MQLGDLNSAQELASQLESEQKWKQLADMATEKGKFDLAQDCLHKAQDYGGLLLLATSSGEVLLKWTRVASLSRELSHRVLRNSQNNQGSFCSRTTSVFRSLYCKRSFLFIMLP